MRAGRLLASPSLHRSIAKPLVAVSLALGPTACGTGTPTAPEVPPADLQAATLGATQGALLPGAASAPAVPGQVLTRVSAGETIENVNAAFGTSIVRQIEGTRSFLVATPAGMPESVIVTGMNVSVLCEAAEPNYILQAPEAERLSIAFYEGTFGHGDYVDQDALLRIGAPAAQLLATGAGVRVAVIDTGADLDHPDLTDNLGAGYDFIDRDPFPADLPNFIDDDGDGVVDEATGHGTHVAGIVAAVAPDVTILPYRVLDSDGLGTVFDVAEAVHRAVADGAQIINLSLGLSEVSEIMRRELQAAEAAGVLVVSSAGNAGIDDRYHFPASQNNTVLAVTATDGNDIKAYFASYGSHIDVSAPGVGIMSTYWNGGYAIWSGTSMAAPFVAGAAALGLELQPVLGNEVQGVIESTSFDLDLHGHAWSGRIGEGRVQLDALACELDSGCSPRGGGFAAMPPAARW